MTRFTSSVSAFPRVRQLCLISILSLTVAACSTLGINNSPPDYSLVASNLVDVLTQIPHLDPQNTTVQVSRSETGFAREVENELRERGYKLEWVHGGGLNQVLPRIEQVKTESGDQRRYVVSVGNVSVERAYDMHDGKTVPASELVVRGNPEVALSLNDDIFEAPDNAFSRVAFGVYSGPQVDDMLSAAPGSAATSWWQQDKPAAIKKNMYETLASNYQEVFAGYEDVRQNILIFPNDSLRIGEANKKIIEEYVADMDPSTDIVSVIGCSLGETEIANGNSLLALGRANRVKEALMFAGLQHDQIMDEGCWAPQLWDEVMPRRGVVLTLKRQKKS